MAGLPLWPVLLIREDAATEGVACIAGDNTDTKFGAGKRG